MNRSVGQAIAKINNDQGYLNANKWTIAKEIIRTNYVKRNQPITLSRLLPLIIAVGKYFATFFTTARIYKGYRARITKQWKKKERKKEIKKKSHFNIKKITREGGKKNPLTASDIKAQSGLSTIGERVPS
jgi:hypothetical protein